MWDDYKLALQLKDAGFPQGGVHAKGYLGPHRTFGDILYYPTLEELVEAIGEPVILSYRKGTGTWFAYVTKIDEHGNRIEVGGWPTLVETLAHLYLALHEK